MFAVDLPPAEQAFLAGQSGLPFLQMWDFILRRAKVEGGLEGSVFATDPYFAQGANLTAISRVGWLMYITQGTDLLTAAAAPAPVGGMALFGMGAKQPTGGGAPIQAGDHDEVDPLGVGGPFWAPMVEM